MLSPETVARQDLLLFLNAAFANTGQAEFYSSKEEQRLSGAFLHEYVRGNYRKLYARMLLAGVNDFNAAEMIFGLLSSGKETPPEFQAEENALLTAALRRLPPQRVWKLAARLRKERINNRRTRALLAAYMQQHADLEFQAIKYRRKLASAAKHAHVHFEGEWPAFLFGDHKQVFTVPRFELYRQARYSRQAVYKLPYSVALGFAAKHRIDPELLLKKVAENGGLTERERLRTQRQSGQQLRPERLSLTELASYLLSMDEPSEEQLGWMAQSARALLRRSEPLALPAGKVAAVLDNSYSSSGSREKKAKPLAVAYAAQCLLQEGAPEFKAFWTHPVKEGRLPQARGQSNLAERLIDALEWGAQTVLVVSDGVENDPPNAFAPVLAAAAKFQPALQVFHFNPVFDAENLEVRGLSPAVPAIGLRDASELPMLISFAAYVMGNCSLEELEERLAGPVVG